MLGMITNLFKKENSKDDAKNRLKLVLIQDRAMLPSGVLENMKDDILKVLSKYVEIEKSKLLAVQGRPVDIGGYYRPEKVEMDVVMRPSAALNQIIDAL